MLRVAGQVLRLLPLRAFPRVIPRDVLGFCYHTVSEQQPAHIRHLYLCKTPAQFECDLEFLCRHYELVTYEDLSTALAPRRVGRPRAILTFDDGFQEWHSIVRPLLLRYGVPAIFFVTTGFLDNRRLFYRHKVSLCIDAYLRLPWAGAAAARRDLADILGTPLPRVGDLPVCLRRLTLQAEALLDSVCARLGVDTDAYLRTTAPYLTSEQVRALASDGFTIGAHSAAHALVSSMTTAEAEADIVGSCAAVAQMVGAQTIPYAFPYAFPFHGRGVGRDMLRSLRARHPHIGLFFDTGLLAQDEEFVINRIEVDGPPRRGRRVTNLPAHVRRAYAVELARMVMGA
jgi:peptidoglycan/xylan/chitin deacetylase (PgdA/CDA1 family)